MINLRYDWRVPADIAAQLKPKPPVHLVSWHPNWYYYYQDLACWLAMKTDCLIFGIKEEDNSL